MRGSASLLIMFGVALVVAGVMVSAGSRIGLGHLPGDIRWARGHLRLYAPLTTSLLVSLALSLMFKLLLRR